MDAKHIMRHLFENIKKGEEQEEVVNETMQQVAFADRILLNKTDLVTKDELDDVLVHIKSINKM